jgi:hypothetical protein
MSDRQLRSYGKKAKAEPPKSAEPPPKTQAGPSGTTKQSKGKQPEKKRRCTESHSPSPAIADDWKHDDQNPLHPIRTHMSQTRFEQIKRYLHIESPSVPKEQKDPSTSKVIRFLHSKVDPILALSAHLVAYVLLGTSEHGDQRSDYFVRSPGYTRAEP